MWLVLKSTRHFIFIFSLVLLMVAVATAEDAAAAEELIVDTTSATENNDGTTTTTTEENVETTTTTTQSNEETTQINDETTSEKKETKKKKKEENIVDDFDVSNEDWGTYYDPQNIFCGKYDCYKILGFDYESYDKVKPTQKEITKRYRSLSREWHPDKSKHKYAKQKFVKIARAYEVLTNKEQRNEYDMMRYNQEAYYQKYGTSVLWSYAPKSDVTIVIILLLIIGNIFSWYSQQHRWQLVADRLIKAAVEDWAPSQGGTPESKQLRDEAISILQEREKDDNENNNNTTESNGDTNTNTNTKSSPKKKSTSKKVSGKERKKQEQEALLPIVTELVNAMDDFGGGFHKPTINDLLIVSMVKFPYNICKGILWQTKYIIRRLQNKELNYDEKFVLTSRAVGPVIWSTSDENEQNIMIERKLYIKENFLEWQEEQEIKNLSSAEQKYYNKLKKKGKLPDKLE